MIHIGYKSLAIHDLCLDVWGESFQGVEVEEWHSRKNYWIKNYFEDKGLREFNLYGT